MGVYVKGMEMPDACYSCPILNQDDCYCEIKFAKADDIFERPNWCPLTEVPTPHGRLIDADATMKQWGLDKATKYGNETAEQQHFSYSSMMMYEIVDILDDAQIVIEAEDE